MVFIVIQFKPPTNCIEWHQTTSNSKPSMTVKTLQAITFFITNTQFLAITEPDLSFSDTLIFLMETIFDLDLIPTYHSLIHHLLDGDNLRLGLNSDLSFSDTLIFLMETIFDLDLIPTYHSLILIEERILKGLARFAACFSMLALFALFVQFLHSKVTEN